jgi:4-amino-4-deoxy-L-arabinose transferase-like glycosyltransferase
MLVFWISFGLAMLAKGPAPLPLVLVPLFFYVAVFRRWKTLPKLLPIAGVIIFLAIVLPWPLLIAHKVNWDLSVWKREFVDRFFGEYASGHKPFFYYMRVMFQFILPWAAFLPMALAAPFFRVWNKKRPAMQFLWLWFVVGLAFLTINGGKRQHYILPFMPAMAILIGILLEDMIFTRKAYTSQYAAVVLRNHIIVIIAGAVAMPIYPIYIARTHSELLGGTIILAAAAIIITAAIAILFAQRHAALGCAAVFAGIVVLVMISYNSLTNPLDYNRHSRDFSRRVAEIIPQSENLVAYKFVSLRSVHYSGRVIPVITDESVLYKHYEDGDWVIATGGFLEALSQDSRFRRVWYEEEAERLGGKDTDGALFHKSAAVIKDDT